MASLIKMTKSSSNVNPDSLKFECIFNEAQITTLEYLLSRYDKIGLPLALEVWLSDLALSSATAENRDRLDRAYLDEEIYESHDYGDHDTFDEAARRDVESIGNRINRFRS